jgi:hypothetical protein
MIASLIIPLIKGESIVPEEIGGDDNAREHQHDGVWLTIPL